MMRDGLLSNVVDEGNRAADFLIVLLQKHPGSLACERSPRRDGMAFPTRLSPALRRILARSRRRHPIQGDLRWKLLPLTAQ